MPVLELLLPDDADEDVGHDGVELGAAVPQQLVHGIHVGHGAPVRAVRYHGLVGIGHGHDSGPERNILAADGLVEPAAVRLAAERATAQDIVEIEAAYAGMKRSIEEGGDYVSSDLRFHQGLLRACHNRMLAHMSKALGALLRTSFEISTTRPDGPASSLPMHRAVLDAVIERAPQKAERAILALIDGANDDIEVVLKSRRKLPSLGAPAPRLKARVTAR